MAAYAIGVQSGSSARLFIMRRTDVRLKGHSESSSCGWAEERKLSLLSGGHLAGFSVGRLQIDVEVDFCLVVEQDVSLLPPSLSDEPSNAAWPRSSYFASCARLPRHGGAERVK